VSAESLVAPWVDVVRPGEGQMDWEWAEDATAAVVVFPRDMCGYSTMPAFGVPSSMFVLVKPTVFTLVAPVEVTAMPPAASSSVMFVAQFRSLAPDELAQFKDKVRP